MFLFCFAVLQLVNWVFTNKKNKLKDLLPNKQTVLIVSNLVPPRTSQRLVPLCSDVCAFVPVCAMPVHGPQLHACAKTSLIEGEHFFFYTDHNVFVMMIRPSLHSSFSPSLQSAWSSAVASVHVLPFALLAITVYLGGRGSPSLSTATTVHASMWQGLAEINYDVACIDVVLLPVPLQVWSIRYTLYCARI